MDHLVRTQDGRSIGTNSNRKLQLRKERADGWSKENREVFLDHLAATCNVTTSAEAIGKGPSSAHYQRRRDPEFAANWDSALDVGYAALELLLVERAQKFASGPPEGEIDAAPVDMTTDQAIKILDRKRKAPNHSATQAPLERVASAKETYSAIIDRLNVLKIRMDAGE